MTPLDWLLVIAINGGIVVWGLRFAKGAKTSFDWLLAARGLPWWIVGLSLFATAVDSGDYVAVVGGSYGFGLQNVAAWWIGMPVGWFIVAWWVFLPIYRAGCFTNSEYLEQRFSPGVRLLGALIQIQYRTNVLGNIAYSLYLTFSITTGWGSETWALVVIVAVAAGSVHCRGRPQGRRDDRRRAVDLHPRRLRHALDGVVELRRRVDRPGGAARGAEPELRPHHAAPGRAVRARRAGPSGDVRLGDLVDGLRRREPLPGHAAARRALRVGHARGGRRRELRARDRDVVQHQPRRARASRLPGPRRGRRSLPQDGQGLPRARPAGHRRRGRAGRGDLDLRLDRLGAGGGVYARHLRPLPGEERRRRPACCGCRAGRPSASSRSPSATSRFSRTAWWPSTCGSRASP